LLYGNLNYYPDWRGLFLGTLARTCSVYENRIHRFSLGNHSKTLESVFSYLKLLKNQDNFSVWAKMDPTMTKTFKGNDGQVGFVSAWDSPMKNVGSGEQEILEIEENVKIVSELRF
jgi:hypothetical protein